MFSAKAMKAYIAAIVAGLGTAITASANGLSLLEGLTIAVVVITAFQATYWTTNEKTYDGSVDVVKQEDGKKTFMLNLDSDPANLDAKADITFKVNSA